jgi:hypothetical protein
VTDFRLPPFDAHIKAQLDVQRGQLKALESEQREPRKRVEQALASLGVPPSFQRMGEAQRAQQTREAIAAWRRDIADREKDIDRLQQDLASRHEGLRELEAIAEREYCIPAPPPAPPPTANPPAAEAINDNGAAAAAAAAAVAPSPPPSEPEPQRLRGRTPVHDWHTIDAEMVHRFYRSGRLVVPEDENVFAEQMLHWYVDELHLYMSPSTMREAVKKVCEHLRNKLASPQKNPPRKPSQ